MITPLSPTDWEIRFDGKTISLDTSIGNWSFKCKSHYFITRNKIHLAGLTDIVITEEEFCALTIPCEKVFIFENKTTYSNLMNFLTLPQMENTIGIFGSGFSVSKLKNAAWLTDKEIFYWGDIDTHGLKILSQIRGYSENTKSIMMDFETLNNFKDEWDKGEPISETSLPNLNSEEQKLFQFVRASNINTIRLEQEKISQEFVLRQIAKIYESA